MPIIDAVKEKADLILYRNAITNYISKSNQYAKNVLNCMTDMYNELNNKTFTEKLNTFTKEQRNEFIGLKLTEALQKPHIPQKVKDLWQKVLESVNKCDELANEAIKTMNEIKTNSENK